MKGFLIVITLASAIVCSASRAHAQDWTIGGNMGLSTLDGYLGFHIAPMAELAFNRNMAIGSEFSLNTQSGLPLQLYPYFKYFISISNSAVRPYVNAGPVMTLNIPGSPSFGILFGGGANIPIARGISIAPDVTSWSYPSSTIFAFNIRVGIRYEL
jgi:hypothetical protein